jgi:hypothetical protein
MGHVHYSVSLVTYLDILGFKDLIRTRSAGEISRIVRVVKEAVHPARFKTRLSAIPDDEYVNFSDLSVIATPLEKAPHNPPGSQLFSQVLHLVHAQSSLVLDEAILIRGAVSIGEVVKSWGQLFGPAVVRAYELERDYARYPRIIVDARIFEILDRLPGAWLNGKREDKRTLRRLLSKDRDGRLFVDYLRALQGELDEPSMYPAVLEQHHALIRKGLRKYAQQPSIREKYEWLDKYHKATIAELKGRLFMPPRDCFGVLASSSIPANSTAASGDHGHSGRARRLSG